jgi:hypothetical protein
LATFAGVRRPVITRDSLPLVTSAAADDGSLRAPVSNGFAANLRHAAVVIGAYTALFAWLFARPLIVIALFALMLGLGGETPARTSLGSTTR